MSQCGCGYGYSPYSQYQYSAYSQYQYPQYSPFQYAPQSYATSPYQSYGGGYAGYGYAQSAFNYPPYASCGLPVPYVYTSPVPLFAVMQHPRGEYRVGNCLMIC